MTSERQLLAYRQIWLLRLDRLFVGIAAKAAIVRVVRKAARFRLVPK